MREKPASTVITETTMATATANDQIIALEHKYWDAMKNDDTAGAIALTYDPCIVTGPQGAATFDHNAMRAMNDQKTWSLKNYELANMNVQQVGDDVAVLGYTAKLEMVVNGAQHRKEYAECSTWVRKDDEWLCVLHSETPLGDPFGGDSN